MSSQLQSEASIMTTIGGLRGDNDILIESTPPSYTWSRDVMEDTNTSWYHLSIYRYAEPLHLVEKATSYEHIFSTLAPVSTKLAYMSMLFFLGFTCTPYNVLQLKNIMHAQNG